MLRQLEQLEIVDEVEANAAGVICERDLQDPQPLGLPHPVRRGQRPAHLRGRHRPAAVGEGKEERQRKRPGGDPGLSVIS